LNAIQQFKIHYPVPQDNNLATWNGFSNEYWPAEYLIDATGIVRRTHFGEGEYDQTEKAIQALLKEKGASVSSSIVTMPDQTPHQDLSSETYLGVMRMKYFFPNGDTTSGQQNFTLSHGIDQNTFSFGGEWNIQEDQAVSGKNAVIEYNFIASKVFLVLSPGSNKEGTVKVLLDGRDISSQVAGSDVENGIITVDQDRLYNLVNLGIVANHLLRLEFQTPGTRAFAFTFG